MKKSVLIILALVMLTSLFSCGEEKINENVTADAIYDALYAIYSADMPASIHYTSSAAEGESGYYDPMIASLDFADGLELPEFDLLEGFSISLPEAKSTFQFAVFKAADEANAAAIKEMAERRISSVKNDPDIINYDTDGSMQRIANDAVLYSAGRYVIILMTSDNAAGIDAVDELLK